MRASHITFETQLIVPWGCENIRLKPEEVALYSKDKVQFTASYYGATKEQYREWLKFHGTARCSALTKRGTPCKSPASAKHLPFDAWLEEDGGFCWNHTKVNFEDFGL